MRGSDGQRAKAAAALVLSDASRVPLRDVVTSAEPGFACGADVNKGLLQLRMNNVTSDGIIDWSDRRRVPPDTADMERYSLEPGDIMFNCTNSPELVGKTALFSGFSEPVAYSNHFLRLRVNRKRAEPGYVSRWLYRQWQRREFERLAICWVNQATVRKDDLLDMEIDLPDLPLQRRIAGILDQADRLRRMRRYALELAQDLVRESFTHAFGGLSYQRRPLAAVAEQTRSAIANGPFGSDLLTTELVDSGVPVLYIRDISSGRFERKSTVFVSPQKAKELEFCAVAPGDVLVAKVGDPPGIAAMYPAGCPPAIVTQDVIRIRPDRSLATSEYLWAYLNSAAGLSELSKVMVEATRQRFSLGQFKLLPVPMPPVSLQQEFSETVEKIEQISTTHREALRQAEHLFQSLLDQYFGEMASV